MIISLAFAIRTSTFQTWLANRVASYLSDEWGTVVTIDQVEIIFFDSAEIKGLYAEDQHGDTLIYAQNIWVEIEDFSFKKKFFYIENIELENTTAYLVKHEGEEDLNLKFIIDYFTPEVPDTSKIDFDFRIAKISLNNVHFKYKDENKPEQDFGVNYKDIDVNDVQLVFSDFKLIPGGVEVHIDHVEGRDKSGAEIFAMRSDVVIDSLGLIMDDLYLEVGTSNLDLEQLKFKTKTWKSWTYFEDSVRLSANFRATEVSLLDVSYFAPPLKGLDQKVKIQGKVQGKVRKLKVKNFDLTTGKHTHIAGSFNIPDYRDFYNSFVDFNFSNIQTSVEDIETFPLYPFDSGKKVQIPSNLRGLGIVNINDGFVYGPISGDGFILEASVKSGLGNAVAKRGIKINYNFDDSTFYYQGPQDPTKFEKKEYDIIVDNVNLKAVTGNDAFGIMDGGIFIKGKGLNRKNMDIDLSGNVDLLQFKGYSYSDLQITEGKIKNNRFVGKIRVEEENISMSYDGMVDFGPSNNLDFNLNISRAMLTKLNIVSKDSSRMETELCADIHVKTSGKTLNNIKGDIKIFNLNFRQDTLDVFMDSISLHIGRSKEIDSLILKSDLIDGKIAGKFDLTGIQNTLKNQFQKIFPDYFQEETEYKEKNSKFKFNVTLHNAQPILNLIYPDIQIAKKSSIKGRFNSEDHSFKFDIKSSRLAYKDVVFDDVHVKNSGAPLQLDLVLDVGHITATEKLKFNQIHMTAHGEYNFINADLVWHVDNYPDNYGSLVWETQIISPEEYILDFDISKIPIRGQTWNIEDRGMVFLKGNGRTIELSNIRISKENREINLDGTLSRDSAQVLNYMIKDFELEDLDEFLTEDLHFDGTMNAYGEIRDIFTNFDITTMAGIDSFRINNEFIGDLMFSQQWNNNTLSFDIEGGIMRKFKHVKEKIKTFDFRGKYYLFREENNLDLALVFDKTDISFVNSFLPEKHVNNVRGFLNGQLDMVGTLSKPIFKGKVDFQAGNIFIDMLGNNFGVMGEIESVEDGFYINQMYITDPDGNTGMVYGSVYHSNFRDWNFNATVDLFNNPFEFLPSGFPKPLERFQLLNTEYEDGDTYYGIAYVTGTTEISGDESHFEISSNIKTLEGTKISFPMYGSTDLSEDDFIVFTIKDSTLLHDEVDDRISGVDLKLKLDISPQTEARIVFDETTGDLIKANGEGIIDLNLNTLGEITMTGKYTIQQGKYYFSMKNLIKKDFTLRKGGTIDWTGSPYEADLDVQAVYSVKASFTEAIPDITNSSNSTKSQVDCVLELSKSLSNPQMDIDIQSPVNNESAKTVLSRIKSSEDELNRQFFSLLMMQKFQPIVGVQSNIGGGVANAVGDALTGQINSILNSIDENYNFNVNYNQDDVNKTERYEIGMSTEVLNDRLVISGNFGLENYSGGEGNQNNFIGDVKIEYKISKDGSFRVSAFNQSNDTRILQTKDLGQFTQGIGIHYEEDFDKFKDFKLLGYFLDLFRKEKIFWDTTPKSQSPKWRSVYDDLEPMELDSNKQDSSKIDDSTNVFNGYQIKNTHIYTPKNYLEGNNRSPFKEEEMLEFKTILQRENEY
ncbi:MAG: translocation/assembly module TamB [Crocinitomicaceae bacterium]|nr:translocation/assembly module TamB [Crocinitomicaceae bacterium]